MKTRPPTTRAAFGRLPVARVSLDNAKAGGAPGDASSSSERPFAAVTTAAAVVGQAADETGPVSSSRTSKACSMPAVSRAKKTAGLCSDQVKDVTASGQSLPVPLLLPAAERPPSHTVSGTAESSCGAAGTPGTRWEGVDMVFFAGYAYETTTGKLSKKTERNAC